MTNDTARRLRDLVQYWRSTVEGTTPHPCEGNVLRLLGDVGCFCDPDLLDHVLTDARDFVHRIGSDGKYRGTEVVMQQSSPRVWIDTSRNSVIGVWGHDRIEQGYTDNIGLADAIAVKGPVEWMAG